MTSFVNNPTSISSAFCDNISMGGSFEKSEPAWESVVNNSGIEVLVSKKEKVLNSAAIRTSIKTDYLQANLSVSIGCAAVFAFSVANLILYFVSSTYYIHPIISLFLTGLSFFLFLSAHFNLKSIRNAR